MKIQLLVYFVLFSNFSYAQDSECSFSGDNFYILDPIDRTTFINIYEHYFSNNGYILQNGMYLYPDKECFILIDNTKREFKIYLDSSDMAQREEVLIQLVGSFIDFIMQNYPNYYKEFTFGTSSIEGVTD